jgi:hypothetical protein
MIAKHTASNHQDRNGTVERRLRYRERLFGQENEKAKKERLQQNKQQTNARSSIDRSHLALGVLTKKK